MARSESPTGAPLAPAHSTAATAATASNGAPAASVQAGVASTIEVVVGRNDTLEAIFRRMALDTADLAAIRQLPGIRQSLDFLKPGDEAFALGCNRRVDFLDYFPSRHFF